MPIYAYKCEACGQAHDALQKISAAPLVDCPACGEPALVKQVTAAGFQLKGSGWYVTDFRNGGGGGKAATSAPAASAPAADKPAASDASTSSTPAAPAAPSTPTAS